MDKEFLKWLNDEIETADSDATHLKETDMPEGQYDIVASRYRTLLDVQKQAKAWLYREAVK